MGVKQTFRDSAPATLTHQGHDIAMPVLCGTIGPDVIDVAKLGNAAGCFTYDPGFTSTANCKSAITFIVSAHAGSSKFVRG